MSYPIDTCEEPLYTLLHNCGLKEVSAEDYNVLASADPATMQSYLESCASDPESYPWDSVIYTLRGEGGAVGGEQGEADQGPPVPIDTIEEPLYTLLYNLGLSEISTADYNVLAVADPDTVQSYLECAAADPESYPWDSVIYTLRGEGDGGVGGEDAAAVDEGEEEAAEDEGGLDGEDYSYAGEEGADGEYSYAEEEEVRELAPLPVIEEEKPPEGSWACQKCTYLNRVATAKECAVCLVARDAETVGYVGRVQKSADGKPHLLIESKDVPNCRHLRGAFKVVKTNSEATFGGKKERVYEIDFFTRTFKNCDLSGKVTISLQSANLYRVERHATDSRALKLLFFKHPNPIDLIFPSVTARQRFVELAALQRRSPVVWCPSFCRNNVKEIVVKVEAKTIQWQGKEVEVAGNQQFMVSRMPYEVQHLWVGTMHLQNRGLPANNPKLKDFCPLTNDMYFIGLQEVPVELVKNGKAITDFFSAFFGTNFYVLLNTASDINIFAGIEGRKQLGSPCVLVIVVRRTGLAKIANVDFVELIDTDAKKPESHGVFVSLRLQESTIGVMVQTIDQRVNDTLVRNGKIQNFLQKIKCGDASQDVSVRFDYFFLMGALGYPSLPTDELHQQIGGQVVLSDFQECTVLQDQCLLDRVLFWHRPRSAKASILKYSSCPGLDMPNLQGQFDLFVQRPYCYALSPTVPDWQVVLRTILFNCDTLTEVRDPECRIMSEAFEALPITLPLKNTSGRYTNEKVPPLLPVTPAYEYLRAQSVSFSLFGIVPGMNKGKKDLIATAVIPLRDMLVPDEPKAHQAFVLRHSTVIGFLETTLVLKRLFN